MEYNCFRVFISGYIYFDKIGGKGFFLRFSLVGSRGYFDDSRGFIFIF